METDLGVGPTRAQRVDGWASRRLGAVTEHTVETYWGNSTIPHQKTRQQMPNPSAAGARTVLPWLLSND